MERALLNRIWHRNNRKPAWKTGIQFLNYSILLWPTKDALAPSYAQIKNKIKCGSNIESKETGPA